jgi:hypothetical protein
MKFPRMTLPVLVALAACGRPETPPPLWRAEVVAGNHDRLDTIVRAPLPEDVPAVRLLEVTAGRAIPTPSQIDGGFLYWVLTGETPRGITRSFHLVAASPTEEPPASSLTANDESGKWIEIGLEGRPVLRYNYGRIPPPDGDVSSPLARNAYLHPVWTPAGRVVTDDFHPSHPHQRGIWMAWTRAEFEGRTPDFWNLADGTGTVRFESLDGLSVGPVFAGLRVRHRHVDLSLDGGEEKTVLEEEWDLKVFRVGGRRWGFHLFELVSVQRLAGETPLILPEYHYGGMAFRGARDWSPGEVRVLTAGDLDRASGDGSRAEWCLMEGPLDRGIGGLAAFGHPLNFRAPQPLRVHDEMPYFAFSPMRLGRMAIVPGEPYVSRYRFLSFDGSAPRDTIAAYWRDYSEPPDVVWSPP